MKNKNVKLGILVLAAVTLFTATVFASDNSYAGYEAFKQIMKDTHEAGQVSNASFNGTFQMMDNGEVVAEMTGKIKRNLESSEASGNVQVWLKGEEQDLSFYKNGESSYLVDETNARYYQLLNTDGHMGRNHKAFGSEGGAEDAHMGNADEALMDYFAGDLKSQFELSQNADGGKSITLDLDQNEIPVPVNLMAAAAVENRDENRHMHGDCEMDTAYNEQLTEKVPFLKEFCELKKEIPELKQDIQLTGLFIKVDTDENNQITGFAMKTTITGKDADGVYHEISLSGSAVIDDINGVSVDIFNPEGKNIEVIDAEEFNCNRE